MPTTGAGLEAAGGLPSEISAAEETVLEAGAILATETGLEADAIMATETGLEADAILATESGLEASARFSKTDFKTQKYNAGVGESEK